MEGSVSSRRVVACLCLLALAPMTSGCAHIVEEGIRSLVGDEGPQGTTSAPGPRGSERTTSSTPAEPATSTPRATPTRSEYQAAPTLDWQGHARQSFTPGWSLFERVAPGRATCRFTPAVPVGLARVYSGPVAPAASPLLTFGPFEVGVTGPDGAVEDVFAATRPAVSARALRSGARMVEGGPYCGSWFTLHIRVDRSPDPVLLNR